MVLLMMREVVAGIGTTVVAVASTIFIPLHIASIVIMCSSISYTVIHAITVITIRLLSLVVLVVLLDVIIAVILTTVVFFVSIGLFLG